MNYKMITYVLGSLLRIEGVLMSIPLVLSFVYGEGPAQKAFLITVLVCFVLGTLIRHREPENKSIYGREGFVVVALSWIVMSLFGAMPFYLSGAIKGFINCFFETVSGFTTTGASILTEIEGLPMSILFWRSFTHWIGGMGILVFMLAILPMGDERSMYMMKAEAPGPMVSKLVPKVKSTAKLLYKIYIALTIIEMILLLLGGMPLFDSVVNSFSTAGTGGFAILNSSIAGYNNAYYEYVITAFMLLFGVNFNLYYFLILRDFRNIWKNEELRYYVGIVVLSIILITTNIYHMYPTFESAFRHAAFQVAAIITTTGFATANFDLWPEFSKALIFCLTILGACAGSTGGGLKVSRLIILLKLAYREIKHIVHPRSVNLIKLDGYKVEEDVVRGVTGYIVIYVLLLLGSFILISFDNYDFTTSLTSVVTCLGNV
ncbi:MAG: TrkH family potassium uptake protein, partial [Anaerotignum sp.]|nr:TrkH family potassium uptake protein [Anaerotignum sp.]